MKKILFIILTLLTFSFKFVKNKNNLNKNTNTETIEAYFPPDDDVRSMLIEMIKKEKDEILCAIFRLTDKQITSALIDAYKRGIKVKVVVDQEGLAGVYNKVLYLYKEGIPTYVFPAVNDNYLEEESKRNMSLMHNKFFVFCSQNTVLTGSYNFTKAAQDGNQENVLIIRFNDVFEKYKKQFKTLCKRSTKI
jgi:phosphatidylserine/phosphatidylglycerophosphate/cardiolipin synthase-like enzyme